MRARDVRSLVLGVCLLASACAPAPNDPPEVVPNPGLYAPGSVLGFVPGADAATGYGTVNEKGPASDGCRGMFGAPGTAGTLSVKFMSQDIGGNAWAPANIGAVWIEWVDPSDPTNFMKNRFVRAIEEWAGLREDSLETFVTRRCSQTDLNKDPDAIVAATLTDHHSQHMATWNGKDVNGQTVPDGEYKLYIEVTEFEEQGPISFFPFTKGPETKTWNPEDGEVNKGLVYTWMPGNSGLPGGL